MIRKSLSYAEMMAQLPKHPFKFDSKTAMDEEKIKDRIMYYESFKMVFKGIYL